jgi:hypothetical protein
LRGPIGASADFGGDNLPLIEGADGLSDFHFIPALPKVGQSVRIPYELACSTGSIPFFFHAFLPYRFVLPG